MNSGKTAILYVVENGCFGGGERAFAQLINGLDPSRYEVYAACRTGGAGSAHAAFTAAIRERAVILDLGLGRKVSPSAFFFLKEAIRSRGIRIVHSQGARADFHARLAARAAGGAAIISTMASPVEEYDVSPARKALYTAVDRLTGRLVDRYISVADHITRKLTAWRGIDPRRITRIYNGVDPALYAPDPEAAAGARAEHIIPPGIFLVGTFCRLEPEKGLIHLIDAAAAIRAGSGVTGAGIKYLIAGEGAQERELKDRVRSLGLEDSFIFPGFVGDIRPLMAALDVFVLPSFGEGFPMSVLEAMAMEKPVVASDIEGISECVTHGSTGLLTPPGDGAALARALSELSRDRERAAGMGRHGRRMISERFNLESMIKAHDELYRTLY